MLTVVSVLGHVAPASAASFGAAADTFALQSQPNTQYGSTDSIQVASAAGSPTSIGYMRFDLSGLSGTVTKATLSIYTASSSAYGVDAHAVADSNWQESTLTWSNRPAYAAAVTANSGPLVAGTRTTIDVTSIVQGDAEPSLAFTSADPFATLHFRSRESHKQAPTLDVTVAGGDTQPPSAPTGLTPTVADSSSIGVAWSASTDDIGVAGYDVYLNGALVDMTTATGYGLTGLSCGTSYTISVDAYDGSGNHSSATPLTASTTSCLAPPVALSAPTITGSPVVGSTLTASPGTWAGDPTSYAYQWQYCTADMTQCTDIAGHTSNVSVPVAVDVGGRDRVKVTATNAAGSGTTYSQPTDVISQSTPLNTTPPSISGTPAVGSTLSASVGVWLGSPTSYVVQWQYCKPDMSSCADIVGYTGSTYTPVLDDVGGRDRVKVTATNSAGSTIAYSSPTAVVSPAAPLLLSPPTITGLLVAGVTLTASTGSWSGSPTSYDYQWQYCDAAGNNCAAIEGATTSIYLLALLDVGSTIRIAVTASNSGGSTTAFSAVTGLIGAAAGATPDFSADPNMTGTLLPWDKFDPGNAASTNGISVSSQPSGANSPGVVAIANDPLGELGEVYQETVTPTAQASTASGSDATYLFNYAEPFLGADGEDNWVHFRMMLPAGYEPTAGEWNIFNEFHNNSNFMSFYNSGQIAWEYPEIALYVTNYSGDVPHLMYRVRGGVDGSNNFGGSDFLVPAQLQLGHWYDILLHVVWSPSATTGLFEWWLDGTRIASVHRPTLWQRPDGSTDHVALELNNYRQHATWNTTVYYSKLEIGASRAAVDF